MSKPSSLGDIIGKVGYGPGGAVESMPELDDQQAKKQIRELVQSVLLEYQGKTLGREGVRLLNELYERMSKL